MTVLRRSIPTHIFAAPAQESAVPALENSAQTPLAAELRPPPLHRNFPHQKATAPSPSLSDPDGAEIFRHDRFFGNAPAVLKFSVGSHVILLKMPGAPIGAALWRF